MPGEVKKGRAIGGIITRIRQQWNTESTIKKDGIVSSMIEIVKKSAY